MLMTYYLGVGTIKQFKHLKTESSICTNLRRPTWWRRHMSDTERWRHRTGTTPVWAPASPFQSLTLCTLKSDFMDSNYDCLRWNLWQLKQLKYRGEVGGYEWTKDNFKYLMNPISYRCSLLTDWPRRERSSSAHLGQLIKVKPWLAP